MTTHILSLALQRQQEILLAKAKLNEKPREVAQIVMYMRSGEVPMMVRYVDMKEAQKQYQKLIVASDHGKAVVLTGSSSTAWVKHPEDLCVAFLADVEAGNILMADTQKRMNALMSMPLEA